MQYDKYIKGMVCIDCFKLIHEKGIIPPVAKINTKKREEDPGINNN